jgi:hypothetical protein
VTTDLLFSILPREGKVPIEHDQQKVEKINKERALRETKDEDEKPFNRRKRGSGKGSSGSRSGQKDRRSSNLKRAKRVEHKSKTPPSEKETVVESAAEPKKLKGPKHLDVYV